MTFSTFPVFVSVLVALGAPAAMAAPGGHNHLFELSGCRACQQPPGQERPRFVVEEIPAEGMTAGQFQALFDEAHHSIEVESTGGFLQRWRDKLRFKQLILNSYRWYSMHNGNPAVANAAANITGLLVASETLEALGGLDLASYGAGRGDWLGAGLVVVGVSLTSPLGHPLCLVLAGAYGKWPVQMNRLLTGPRLFVVYAVKAGSYLLTGRSNEKLKAIVEEIMKARFARALDASETGFDFQIGGGGDAEFALFGPDDDDQYIELRMVHREDGRQALASVGFSEKAKALSRAQLKKMVKPFGVNITDLVLGIGQRAQAGELAELRLQSYVENVEEEPLMVRLKPGAFPFYSLQESDFPCEEALGN